MPSGLPFPAGGAAVASVPYRPAPPMRRLSLTLLLLALAAGCDSASDRTAYDVTFSDEGGAVVATGRLDFDAPVVPGATVSGTYRLSEPNLTPNQSGRLRAECTDAPGIRENFLMIRLDLDVDDAGLSLGGRCDNGLEGGAWSRIFIGGGLPGGTFEVE